MKMKFFGDSYDFSKRCLMEWLAPEESWAVHPMFTEQVSQDDAKSYGGFLRAHVLTTKPLTLDQDRAVYFADVKWQGHLLFDPDTGVWRTGGRHTKPKNEYIYQSELAKQVALRPKHLTVVFDQAVSKTKECDQMSQKLSQIINGRLHGIAYAAQASFLILTCDENVIIEAQARLLKAGLPECRVIAKSLQ